MTTPAPTNAMTAAPALSGVATLCDALRARAQAHPHQTAFRFITDARRFEDESGSRVVTYGELDARAGTIAAALGEHAKPGDRAVLLYAPGPDYIAAFFGCLYAGVVAVPAYPPYAGRSVATLVGIVRDASPSTFLTSADLLDGCRAGLALEGDEITVPWLATDALTTDPAGFVVPDAVASDALAFLQYTSGSTGNPRGVMVTHANLLANISAIVDLCRPDADVRVTSWLPPYHDMGLIGGILMPICTGIETVLMAPFDFLRDPLCWLEAMAHFGTTHSVAPNFAYDLCVRKADPDRLRGLDLSHWKFTLSGAEPVRAATMDRFAETFAPCGFDAAAFLPVYGLAEATLLVAGSAPGTPIHTTPTPDAQAGKLVSVGCPVTATAVQIVDPETRTVCPDGEVGEIWVAGPGVANGYWNRPGDSEQSFRAELAGGNGPYLRTGDLGLIQDGDLYVAGRIKDMVIIRGRNYFPQDLEEAAWSADRRLRAGCAAAFSVTADTEEQLVIAAECASPVNEEAAAEIARGVRSRIAQDHGIVVHGLVLLTRGTIPKTSSGKIRRSATKAGYLGGELSTVASSTLEVGQRRSAPASLDTVEDKLAFALAAVIDADGIGPDDDFFALGGDSLRAVEATAVAAEFGLAFDASVLYANPTVRRLAGALTRTDSADGPRPSAEATVAVLRSPIPPVEDANSYPLSPIQRRWAADYLGDRRRTWGNMSQRIPLDAVDVDVLKAVIRSLWLQHESLRTLFPEVSGELRQIVIPDCDVPLDVHDLRGLPDEEQGVALAAIEGAAAAHVFDLANGPLTRATLVRTAPDAALLLLTAHHMIADGWSFLSVRDQIEAAYTAAVTGSGPAQEPAEAMLIRYRDYAVWMNRLETSGLLEDSRRYWCEELVGDLPDTLPVDATAARTGSAAGASVVAALPAELADAVTAAAAPRRVSVAAILYAAFFAAIGRRTGGRDLIIGTPLAGRDRADIRDVVGMFINLVPIRMRVEPDGAFKDLVEGVQTKLLKAVTHQRWQLDRMAEDLGIERQPHKFAVTNTFFTKMDVGGAMALPPGSGVFARELPIDVRFHMMFYAYQYEGGILVECKYRGALFSADEVTAIVEDYLDVLRRELPPTTSHGRPSPRTGPTRR